MHKALLVIALGLALAACPAGTQITPETVAAWLKSNCGVLVQAIDIAALISANPTVANVAALGGQVCDAIKAHRAEQLKGAGAGARIPNEGVVTVGGVPIHYTTQ